MHNFERQVKKKKLLKVFHFPQCSRQHKNSWSSSELFFIKIILFRTYELLSRIFCFWNV